MKKVIITGISGQVGSYMAEYCLSLGHLVFGLARNIKSNNENYKHLLNNSNLVIIECDLCDTTNIENIIKQITPDYFINLAAQSSVGDSWKIPELTFDVDTMGVIRCLEAIRKYAPKCRFYNSGSSEQFGEIEYFPQDESHKFSPKTPYGVAKCAAHNIIKIYRTTYNIYAVQGILFNHESERRGKNFVTRKISMGVANIIKQRMANLEYSPIELGNMSIRRDWSHVEDFVDGIWKMLNQDIPKDYVLASGETHSVYEFVELAFHFAGISGHWIGEAENECFMPDFKINNQIPLVKVNPEFYRPAETTILLGNNAMAKSELNWNPNINFKNLVRRMVANDLKNIV